MSIMREDKRYMVNSEAKKEPMASNELVFFLIEI